MKEKDQEERGVHAASVPSDASTLKRAEARAPLPPDRLPIPPIRQTHTFAVLAVNPSSYDDIKVRLEAALGPEAREYLQEHDGRVLIVFGTVALERGK